jgi:hypothetical protein
MKNVLFAPQWFFDFFEQRFSTTQVIHEKGTSEFLFCRHQQHQWRYNRGHPKVNDSLRKFPYFSLD